MIEKRRRICRQESDGDGGAGEKKRRWLDNIKNDLSERELSGEECTTVLHGGVCHRTSTQHKSRNTDEEEKECIKKVIT